MTTMPAMNIDTKTILIGTYSPSLKQAEKSATTVSRSEDSIAAPEKMAITQWLTDGRNEQDSQATSGSLSAQYAATENLTGIGLPERKFRAALLPRLPLPEERFVALQRWEGIVLAIHDEVFEARLVSLQGEQKGEHFAEIYRNEVDIFDRPLLQIGAVFYWAIGYLHKRNGNTWRASILRFRRIPRLGEEILGEAGALAEEWGKL
jgi:hypothetical protein